VKLNDDLFIVNVEQVLHNLEESIIVNCSKELDEPELFEEQIDEKDFLRRRLKLSENSFLNIVVDGEHFCIPTLIGLLIGYPVVYWYSKNSADSTCLDGASLSLLQYFSNENNLIMSFSVPKSVLANDGINDCLKRLDKKATAFGLRVEKSEKVLNVVVL
jgi:hypothetical protein